MRLALALLALASLTACSGSDTPADAEAAPATAATSTTPQTNGDDATELRDTIQQPLDKANAAAAAVEAGAEDRASAAEDAGN